MKHRLWIVTILCASLCALLFNPVVQAPLAHGAIHQLTNPPGFVRSFGISPDGKWVVFVMTTSEATGLYSVPLTGGPVVQLAYAVAYGDNQTSSWRRAFAISPDSQSVLFFGRPDNTSTPTPDPGQPYVHYPGMGLYSVPIDGSAGSLVVADDPRVHTFAFSPDSQRAIYTTGTGTDYDAYHYELYSRALSGGPLQRLNIDLANGQSVAFDRWAVLQTGHVVYAIGVLSYNNPYGPSTGFVDLYTVPLSGPAQASSRINPCGQVFAIDAFKLSRNGQRIIFESTDCDGGGVLRSVDATGGSSIRLSPAVTTKTPGPPFVTEDDRFVVYTLSETVGGQAVRDLYIAPLAGPSDDIHLIQSGAVPGINPQLAAVAPNGEWVAFLAPTSSVSDEPTELYVASRTGASNNTRLVTALMPNGVYAHIAPDNQHLIYREVGGTFMSLDLMPGSSPISLGIAAATYTSVFGHTGTDRLLVRDISDSFLYSVPASGPASARIRISQGTADYSASHRFTPDGRKVVYVGHSDGQLYVTDIDQPYNEQTPVCDDPPNCPGAQTQTSTASSGDSSHQVFLPSLNR